RSDDPACVPDRSQPRAIRISSQLRIAELMKRSVPSIHPHEGGSPSPETRHEQPPEWCPFLSTARYACPPRCLRLSTRIDNRSDSQVPIPHPDSARAESGPGRQTGQALDAKPLTAVF